MLSLVRPHGGKGLKPLLLTGDALKDERARARSLSRIPLSTREAGDLVMLGIGGFTPLEGFMGRADWRGVCEHMHTADGLFWPVPITLSCAPERAHELREGQELVLVDPRTDTLLGTMTLAERYEIDKAYECKEIYRTTDANHPGVRTVMEQGSVNLAGPVRVLAQGEFPERYPKLFLTPSETRIQFEARGWRTVAALQTRNPMHRSHEYLARIAIEVCDGLLIHSLLGHLKADDIPAEVRARAIEALIANYLDPRTVIHAGYPLDMRYAGPREALLHALFRQNYGCSHLIVGRDHAGVGSYYGPFDAHAIFDEIPGDALEIKALKIDWTFWCDRCDGMASARTCPHEERHRLRLSGTKLRKALSDGLPIPDHFSRPEVLAVLREYYAGLEQDQRVDVQLAGHSAR